MYNGNPNNICLLDSIRLESGVNELKNSFSMLAKNNPDQATALINDQNLLFCSLFVLQSEVKKPELYTRLNSRNQAALDVISRIFKRKADSESRSLSDYRQIPYSVLKWILVTGCRDDGFSNRYDEVLDFTAILLVKIYRDKAILPIIAEIIFNRYRKGLLMYELLWAFFECRDPASLTLIASRLCSPYKKDVELAEKLLGFLPCINKENGTDRMRQYFCFLQWLRENHSFLYYTGENLQQTCNPQPYAVSLKAKYLCKPVSANDGSMISPLTEDESRLLEIFEKHEENVRTALSSYSYYLHLQNPLWWKQWLHYPADEQVRTARLSMGGWI